MLPSSETIAGPSSSIGRMKMTEMKIFEELARSSRSRRPFGFGSFSHRSSYYRFQDEEISVVLKSVVINLLHTTSYVPMQEKIIIINHKSYFFLHTQNNIDSVVGFRHFTRDTRSIDHARNRK